VSLLRDHSWKARYDSDMRSLVQDFYEPALGCAVRYDRSTGFFSAAVLTLVSRGLEGLIRNGGRMRLIVGCRLGEAEIEAIKHGLSLREAVERSLAACPLSATTGQEACRRR
jgi:hypothetical protein